MNTNLRILLATIYAAAVAIIANTLITRAGLAAGAATETPAHMPVTGLEVPFYVALSIVGVLIGAVGWTLIGRRARRPARALKIAVPIVWVISLLPLVASGVMSGTHSVWTAMVTLAIVHTTTVVIGVLVYLRVLPLSGLARRSAAA